MDEGARAHREALARFLRTRRARVSPAEAGIEPGVRRRTPGLRREEVATLSGVGITWYTWLEQGRDIHPSPAVLDAIARTLRLDAPSRDYLFRLAGVHPGEAAPLVREVPEPLERLVRAQGESPAVLMDAAWNVLAFNEAAHAVYGYGDVRPEDRNVAWMMLTSPRLREMTRDWETHARRIVGELREAFARHPADAPALSALFARLREASPEAARWLDERDVQHRAGNVLKVLDHPEHGELRFVQTVLDPREAPGSQLVVLQPDEETRARLAALPRDRARVSASPGRAATAS
ncbi:XRE family transcriptional regulator [Actinomadura logoneensis]|uniref:XRE family transcriptional regulator n=1 Tax=Actinomadura logoneensis TaxID=2293572 RepID=A0A372JUQ3_9ACTN|nr:helix-turn-helix transcriptional regulator [Actinomadura logoneensis]RFU43474.1 XRE family transcriptional regulator [Actinomadura logoneensis]